MLREINLKTIIEDLERRSERAEAIARAFRDVLIETAVLLAGDLLESERAARRSDPKFWTPEEWRAFWARVSRQIRPAGTPAAGWPAGGNGHGADVEALRRQLADAESERQKLLAERQRLLEERQRLMQELAERAKPAAPVSAAVSRQRPGESEAAEERAAEGESREHLLPQQYQQVVRELRTIALPDAPAMFQSRLKREDSELRYRRKIQFLHVLATRGYCTRLELDLLIATAEGLSLRTASVRRAADDLTEARLVISETLSITSPLATRLVVHRLSEDGKLLCRMFGWSVVESEWERVLRLHEGEKQEEHTLMLLAFAMHARVRGWDAAILPQVSGKAVPDILVEREDGRWYVEVERGDGSDAKWRNLAELNGGRVALCAGTPETRQNLVSQVKRLRLGGVATDLFSLIFQGDEKQPRSLRDITPQDDLWFEAW